jgi:hypothetical protein
VLSRVGKEEAGTMGWRVSNDLAGTFLQGMDITLHCIKNLMAEDDAVFKTTPYHENPITAVFDVRGLRTAMAPYATEMKTFRELPAVADPTWVNGMRLRKAQRYEKMTASQVNSIHGGCLKIVSMIFCIIMSISGVFAGLAFSGSTVVEDDGFEWGALIIAGVFGLGFVTMEIFRRANARKAKELSDQLDAL